MVSVFILVGRCMAVDREFTCILFMCIYFSDLLAFFWIFGAHFAFLGATLGLLLGALGSQGALLGVTLAALWLPWGSVGPFGAPRASKGSLG